MLLISIACIFSSILLSIVGCLMVWNKYTYLTDSIIHVLVLAVVFNSISGYPLEFCSCCVSVLFVTLSIILQKYFPVHNLVLNVVTTSLIATSLMVSEQLNLDLSIESILFGDLLLTNIYEVIFMGGLTIFSIILIWKNFDVIIITAINQDIAASLGIKVLKWRIILLCFAALNISMVVKIMGGLMVSSLSIVPVFFARVFSQTPQRMLVLCIVFSLILSFAGLQIAFIL